MRAAVPVVAGRFGPAVLTHESGDDVNPCVSVRYGDPPHGVAVAVGRQAGFVEEIPDGGGQLLVSEPPLGGVEFEGATGVHSDDHRRIPVGVASRRREA